eukprot:GAFH01005181.1.p2 GENE.GAFH01005181.1~~GAFH01005181.1.p2  ORF type:complete len:163 (-),score=30.33 GAFH01005181.1:165-653(-)
MEETTPEKFETPLALLKDFLTLQEERVHTYQRFDENLKNFLADHNEAEYLRHVRNTTSAFQSLSEEIIEIRRKLEAKGHRREGELIGQLQDQEREKLRLTVGIHQLKTRGVRTPGDEEQMHAHLSELGGIIDTIGDLVDEIRELKNAEQERNPPKAHPADDS